MKEEPWLGVPVVRAVPSNDHNVTVDSFVWWSLQCNANVLHADVETEKQRRGTWSCESRESEGSTNPQEDFEDPLPLTDDVATSNNFSSSSSL